MLDSFALVGAGRMGTAFALCLVRAGLEPRGIWSRSPGARRRARTLLGGGRSTVDPVRAAAGAPLVLLGVPDDPLEGVVDALARAGAVAPGSLWVHLSGFHGLAPLGPAARAGGRVVAIHPLQTISNPAAGPERLTGALFTVVAEDKEWPVARTLVEAAGGNPLRMPGEGRVLYHAAAVLACNDLVALFALAAKLMQAATGGALGGKELIGLIRSTLAGLERSAPETVLTGPVARGDVGVVAAHLDALEKRAPWALPAYIALGRETLALAMRRGSTQAGHGALDALFRERTTRTDPETARKRR